MESRMISLTTQHFYFSGNKSKSKITIPNNRGNQSISAHSYTHKDRHKPSNSRRNGSRTNQCDAYTHEMVNHWFIQCIHCLLFRFCFKQYYKNKKKIVIFDWNVLSILMSISKWIRSLVSVRISIFNVSKSIVSHTMRMGTFWFGSRSLEKLEYR